MKDFEIDFIFVFFVIYKDKVGEILLDLNFKYAINQEYALMFKLSIKQEYMYMYQLIS